jgi:2-keto-myo-inositol isomerase
MQKSISSHSATPAPHCRSPLESATAAQPERQVGKVSRRTMLKRTGLLAGGGLALAQQAAWSAPADSGRISPAPFRFCLNTATIRGQKLGIVREVEIAAKAGFEGIEPWVSSIEEYVRSGGSLSDLKKRIADSGVSVESAIAFSEWLVDAPDKRAKALEQAKREMNLVAEIGGKRLAAPPAGATNPPALDLFTIADRYRALLEVGDQVGIVPELELWGFSANLHLLSQCAFAAIQTGHPKACVLCDMFHLYKGGSDYHTLSLLSGNAVQVFHMNDYPADPPRERINDSYRVFPGDGSAPLVDVLRTLRATGGVTVLSLEVFNKGYWAMDALEAASTGFRKMRNVVQQALR